MIRKIVTKFKIPKFFLKKNLLFNIKDQFLPCVIILPLLNLLFAKVKFIKADFLQFVLSPSI